MSASTIMAPTHDRVVGMDPDDVQTPISVPTQRTWERPADTIPPPLPVRASTQTNKSAQADGEDSESKPQLPTRPSEIAGYGGAEISKTRTEERVEQMRADVRSGVHKVKGLLHHEPKDKYFAITESVNNHLEKEVFKKLTNGSSTLKTSEFVKFLKEVQGQEVELPAEKTQLRDFGLDREKTWTYKEWLAFLCRSGALEGVRPVGKVGLVKPEGSPKGEETEEDKSALGYPITSYFIDSSHNTYLQGHQWFSTSTADAYKYVSAKSELKVYGAFELILLPGPPKRVPLHRN